MNLPGLSFFRERGAMRAFEAQDPAFRELVFYSEGAGDWPHIGPVIQALLADHDQKISYLSSDPADPGLKIEDTRFHAFAIGSGTVRTILFARIKCTKFVMTLPDLGNLWLKRSVHPVHYVYLFHSMNSTHTSYRKGAFDSFDTILCVGPYHVAEIRRAEDSYGLRPKNLVEHGSPKLDSVMARLDGEDLSWGRRASPQILVAPSWGDCSLIERPVGRSLLETLLSGGYRTVLRLHPMTVRRLPQLVSKIKRSFDDHPLFTLEQDMNSDASWMASDLMISDWSGAALEYAFALEKPVLYIDTPQKILNADFARVDRLPFEAMIRHEIGQVLGESELEAVAAAIDDCIRLRDARRSQITQARSRWIYNVGTSSKVAAEHLAAQRPRAS